VRDDPVADELDADRQDQRRKIRVSASMRPLPNSWTMRVLMRRQTATATAAIPIAKPGSRRTLALRASRPRTMPIAAARLVAASLWE
jgi:hypothetical protein